jgi:phosphate transport system substrate-binding protein
LSAASWPYHVPGIQTGRLKISAAVLGDIFLGKITKWNDAAIAAINPGVKLPDVAITDVHRADGSGTTGSSPTNLEKISDTWRQRVGSGKSFPGRPASAAKGNEGVAAYVQRTKGSIGYVEFAYALQNKLNYVQLQNKAGKSFCRPSKPFRRPRPTPIGLTPPGFYMVLTDHPATIAGRSPALRSSWAEDAERPREGHGDAQILRLVLYPRARGGGDIAKSLHYVPLPATVISMVRISGGRKSASTAKRFGSKGITSGAGGAQLFRPRCFRCDETMN